MLWYTISLYQQFVQRMRMRTSYYYNSIPSSNKSDLWVSDNALGDDPEVVAAGESGLASSLQNDLRLALPVNTRSIRGQFEAIAITEVICEPSRKKKSGVHRAVVPQQIPRRVLTVTVMCP
jgi:hypothetical protein